MYHLKTLLCDIYSNFNACFDVKLCSKVRNGWEGVEEPLMPVLLSEVAGV